MSPALIVRDKQLRGFPRVPHPPAGIESRAQHEPDPLGVYLLSCEVRRLDERPHPGERGHLQPCEAEPRDHSVLTCERNDISDRAQRRERQEIEKQLAPLIIHALAPRREDVGQGPSPRSVSANLRRRYPTSTSQLSAELVILECASGAAPLERRGATGFGQGNFKALFEAIERARRGNL